MRRQSTPRGSLTVFPVGFGEHYCTSLPNSMGRGAEIGVRGSASVTADDLHFAAHPMPPNQPGIVFCAPSQLEVPFGNGLRCVGGQLLRSSPVYAEGTLLRKRVDLALGHFAGQLVAGSRWNFQAWFRDPMAGGYAFNTSDALSIVFEP